MRRTILLGFGFLLLASSWIVAREAFSAAPENEPLWAPLPGLAFAPSRDPIDSKDICNHAINLKARFSPTSVHTAILGYAVEPDGSLDDIAVAGTSGSKALDRAIIACVTTLRFEPAKKGHAMTVGWK